MFDIKSSHSQVMVCLMLCRPCHNPTIDLRLEPLHVDRAVVVWLPYEIWFPINENSSSLNDQNYEMKLKDFLIIFEQHKSHLATNWVHFCVIVESSQQWKQAKITRLEVKVYLLSPLIVVVRIVIFYWFPFSPRDTATTQNFFWGRSDKMSGNIQIWDFSLKIIRASIRDRWMVRLMWRRDAIELSILNTVKIYTLQSALTSARI